MLLDWIEVVLFGLALRIWWSRAPSILIHPLSCKMILFRKSFARVSRFTSTSLSDRGISATSQGISQIWKVLLMVPLGHLCLRRWHTINRLWPIFEGVCRYVGKRLRFSGLRIGLGRCLRWPHWLELKAIDAQTWTIVDYCGVFNH